MGYVGDIFVVDSTADAEWLLAKLERTSGPKGVDCETYNCDPKKQSPCHTAKIVCWSVAWFELDAPKHPVAPNTYVASSAFIWAEYLQTFKPWLESEVPKVGASFSTYDMHCFENHGIRVGGLVHDNKYTSRFWYSSKDVKHDLKSQLDSVLGYRVDSYASLFSRAVENKPKVYKADKYYVRGNSRSGPLAGVPTLVIGGSWSTFSHAERELIPLDRIREDHPDRIPELIPYAALDAKGSLELMLWREAQLESRVAKGKESSLGLYRRIWQPGLLMLQRMERRGMALDVDVCSDIRQRAESDMADLLPAIQSFAGDSAFNPGSWQQLQGLLRDKLKLRTPEVAGTVWATRHPKKDEWSTSEASLAWLQVKYPEYFQGIDSLRKWKKIRRQMQFARDLPSFVSTVDSRLHTVLGPEADTGRLSAKLPALQQIPSKNDQYGIRGAFVAGPGNSLIVSDFAQLEVYVLAHMLLKLNFGSELAEALKGDVYIWLVEKIWPDLAKHWTRADYKVKGHPAKIKRDLAKILVLAVNYGKTATGLAMSLIDFELDGEPASESYSESLLADYHMVLPGISKFHKWIAKFSRENGGVPSLLGRWRPIPESRSDKRWEAARGDRKAQNTPMQASAMDIALCAMLGLNSYDGVPGFMNEEMRDLKGDVLMQIHDELILECPTENAPKVKELTEVGMCSPPHIELELKLKTEAGFGLSWKEAKV